MSTSSFGLPFPPYAPGMVRHAMLVALVLLGGMLCSGCRNVTKSVYSRPALDIPAQWRDAAVPTGSGVARNESWWRSFNDPELDALIERVLRTNNNLAAATIAVYRARLQSGLADTGLMPDVTVQAQRSDTGRLLGGGSSIRTSSITAAISYELDLWGRFSRLRDAAAWEAQATEYDRRAIALSLIGTSATLYWKIAYQNQLIRETRLSIEHARKTLELVEIRHAAGGASELDKVQARANLAAQQADLDDLIRQQEADRNALAILFDQPPSKREAERDALAIVAMPPLPAVLPAELLRRRPDLQAAESRLRAALSSADATRLTFYPSFSLLGSAGTAGVSFPDILKNPVSALGATLALPLVQWNMAELATRAAKADFEAAVVNFRQTFYQALAEVQDALSARTRLEREAALRSAALDDARKAERLAEVRFRAGKTCIKDWLDLQQARRVAEMRLAQTVFNQYVTQMTLYRALGGG